MTKFALDKKILPVALILSALVFLSPQLSAEISLSDSNLKGRFLYQFIFYTQWPEAAENSDIDEFKIGIIGDDSIVKLYKQSRSPDIRGRKVTAYQLGKDLSRKELSQYHILFIRQSQAKQLATILKSIEGLPILTVSENLNTEAMIDFVNKKDKLRFYINSQKSELVGIRFRSQLLRLGLNDPKEG